MEKEKKVIVLGANGMLGHVVSRYLKKHVNVYRVYNLARNIKTSDSNISVDLLDFEALKKVIISLKPNIIINCAGLLVKDSLGKPSKAILTNSYIPHYLNEMSFEYDYKLIHISTDCVFSGKKGNYDESSHKDETNYYGLSKNLGEIINDKNLTIRTSIIGPELKANGTGLLHWFLNQKKLSKVSGYSKVIWSGLSTIELSKFIHYCICYELNGLVHATNNQSISKYDLLKLIKEIFKLSIVIEPSDDYLSNKSIRCTNKLGYNFPSYEIMIKEMAEWMASEGNDLYDYNL